jgi:glycerate 2-kinase
MRVLIAPDKFRGTMSAREAAGAIAAGWQHARPWDHLEEAPLADGGEGTLDLLVDTFEGERRRELVTGPLGDVTQVEYGVIRLGGRLTSVVETSRASGLHLIADGSRDVLRATTRGTGELIRAASRGSSDLLVCLGGSATNDGGAGMAQALGARLLDTDGRDLRPGGAALIDLVSIDISGMDPLPRRARVLVACDVDNPLTGPHGASAVYAPQKGASAKEVRLLDRALTRFADLILRDLGIDVRDVPGAGAAGGLGAGLVAFLDGSLLPGVDVIMEATHFDDRLRSSDLVITGEGRFDAGSSRGKVPAGVMRHARRAGKEALILCGRFDVRPDGVRVESLVERFGEERAMGDSLRALQQLAEEVAAHRS